MTTTEHVDVSDPDFVRHYVERTGRAPVPGEALDPTGVNYARTRVAFEQIARARATGASGVFPTPGRPGEWTPVHAGTEYASYADESAAHSIAADGGGAFSARREASTLREEVRRLREAVAQRDAAIEALKSDAPRGRNGGRR